MLTNVNSAREAKFIVTFAINPLKMSRKYFRNISILAIVSLLCLAVVQSVWVYRMYSDSVTDFRRRVESAIYKSIYKWSGDTVHIYLAFISEDWTIVSDSQYVGSETIA